MVGNTSTGSAPAKVALDSVASSTDDDGFNRTYDVGSAYNVSDRIIEPRWFAGTNSPAQLRAL
jgi:hypothetical protein